MENTDTQSDLAPSKASRPLCAPVLIGVSGKRDLKGSEGGVRTGFEAMFDILDTRLVHTPKILLSALASGADMVAAEAALARKWRIIAPLPFKQDLYEQDFKDQPADLARLRALIAHPDVDVVPLAPLRQAGTDRPIDDRALGRMDTSNPERSLHYEQVGLYVAERCALLIAVVEPGEKPDRIGGTGRIVDWRLRGPDRITQEVRARSVELLYESVLEEPRTAPVWRILLEPDRSAANPPLRMTTQMRSGEAEHPLKPGPAMDTSLSLLVWMERLNRQISRTTRALPASGAGGDGWTEDLDALRSGLSHEQGKLKRRVQRILYAIAGLFLSAIVSLEAHIALDYGWSSLLGIAYAFAAVLAVGLYMLASASEWQPLSEDYRAAAEALRAQLALWRAGLVTPHDRVDLRYLRSAHGSLARLRHAIGQMVEVVRLSTRPSGLDLRAVEVWIDGQVEYFSKTSAARHAGVTFAQATSWFLFTAGLGVSVSLGLVQLPYVEKGLRTIGQVCLQRPGPIPALAMIAILEVIVAWIVGRAREAAGNAGVSPRRRILLRTLWVGFSLFGGLILAAGLWDIAMLLPAPHAGAPDAILEWHAKQAERFLVMGAVVVTAIAGAIRFLADKLSWEAELLGYEHACGYFQRASAQFKILREANDEAGLRVLVRDLVDEALRENEAWLTAHRERPLEPVIGG